MDDLIRPWERVETWLREHQCTGALSALRPPASEEAVQSLQDAVPYPLHPHLVQWLGLHDGGSAPVWPSGGFVPYGTESLKCGPGAMADMLEEFHDQFTEEEIQDLGLTPWAHPFWLPIAGTNTGESLLIDHRPGDTYGAVLEIDYDLDFWGEVRWKNLGEMIRLMAESLEAGSPLPYSREYSLVRQLDGEPAARRLAWKLEKIQD
ncbi:SMI1/KNR4 family protein [Streptomyces kurssanovii]|uniref:SMI1/KNR4 family protein n=1 Tax=Streptomyces kurssanovii TaxID=67312 RepID=A0ABV3HXW9_9ACTN